MPNELPLPDELQHLIEKRESAGRRQENRRANHESDATETDRRSDDDRRQNKRRAGTDRFRPGDQPGQTGRYRCESCLNCVHIAKAAARLPTCPGCGNRSESLYAIVSE